MFKYFGVFLLLACSTFGMNALAGTSIGLNGTWMLDPKATETYIVELPHIDNPDRVAEGIGLESAFLVLLVYEFRGDIATLSMYNATNKKLEYKCLPAQDAKIICTSINVQGSAPDNFTVSVLNAQAITIIHPHASEMGYVVWKRVNIDPKQSAPDFAQAHLKAWKAPFEHIMKALHAQANATEH